MDDIIVARSLHVLAVVHWIGGVTLVTLVILPAISHLPDPTARLHLFEAIEGRFSSQAKISVTLAGLSGFYIVYRLDVWDRFLDAGFWWMHAMVLIWVVFTIILFIAEPLYLNAWFRYRADIDPTGTVRLIQRAHGVLLTISLLTVGAAVLGAHGMLY